jgi:pimeloyl-ACP methyl ester carboxylesterase
LAAANRPLAAKKTRARAEVIPNTGHFAFLEAPQKFDEFVLDFLKQ